MPALLRHPAVRALRRGRTVTSRVTSDYYDTSDFLLAQAEVALRLRRIGGRWVQTIKGPAEDAAGAGLHARPEHEWRLPRAALDMAHLSATPWRKLLARAARHGGLARRFTTDFERRTIPLRFPDGTLALLCVDHGEIRAVRDGRRRRVPIAEIEIELESGAAANLFGLALRLADDLPVAIITASKAERGIALLRGERDLISAPARAHGVALAEDVTTADALSARLRECLQQIAANAPGLLADDDPEWVHQMRIGTRRLRAGLALVAPFASSRSARPRARRNEVARRGARPGPRLGRLRRRDAAASRDGVRAGSRDRGRAPALARPRRVAPPGRAGRGARRGRLAAPAAAAAAGRHAVRDGPLRDAASRRGRRAGRPARRRRRRVRGRPSRAPPAQARPASGIADERNDGGAARRPHRREEASLRRRILRSALSAQARQGLSRGARPPCRTCWGATTTRRPRSDWRTIRAARPTTPPPARSAAGSPRRPPRSNRTSRRRGDGMPAPGRSGPATSACRDEKEIHDARIRRDRPPAVEKGLRARGAEAARGAAERAVGPEQVGTRTRAARHLAASRRAAAARPPTS